MNRIFVNTSKTQKSSSKAACALLRPTQRLRDDAEAMLRDIAYVLYLTRRVKSEMLHERELVEAASA